MATQSIPCPQPPPCAAFPLTTTSQHLQSQVRAGCAGVRGAAARWAADSPPIVSHCVLAGYPRFQPAPYWSSSMPHHAVSPAEIIPAGTESVAVAHGRFLTEMAPVAAVGDVWGREGVHPLPPPPPGQHPAEYDVHGDVGAPEGRFRWTEHPAATWTLGQPNSTLYLPSFDGMYPGSAWEGSDHQWTYGVGSE